MKPAPVAVQPRAEQQRVGVLQDKTSKLVGAKKDPKGAPGEARRLGREGGDAGSLFFKSCTIFLGQDAAACAGGARARSSCCCAARPKLLAKTVDAASCA